MTTTRWAQKQKPEKEGAVNEALRLYVWPEAYCCYCYVGVFALAANVEEARLLIRKELDSCDEGGCVGEHLKQEPIVVNQPRGFFVGGGVD